MDKEIRDKIIRALGDNRSEGDALKDWLKEKLEKYNTVEGAKDMSEVSIRQGRAKMIQDLLKVLEKEPIKKINKENQYD